MLFVVIVLCIVLYVFFMLLEKIFPSCDRLSNRIIEKVIAWMITYEISRYIRGSLYGIVSRGGREILRYCVIRYISLYCIMRFCVISVFRFIVRIRVILKCVTPIDSALFCSSLNCESRYLKFAMDVTRHTV